MKKKLPKERKRNFRLLLNAYKLLDIKKLLLAQVSIYYGSNVLTIRRRVFLNRTKQVFVPSSSKCLSGESHDSFHLMAYALYKVERQNFTLAEFQNHTHLSDLRYDHFNPQYFKMKVISDVLLLQIKVKRYSSKLILRL